MNSEKEKIFLESLERKKKEVESLIKYYSAGATTVGAVPIPFADAPILISGQIAMILKIFKIYGVENILPGQAITGIFLERIIAQGGRALAKYLLKKAVPGLGSVVTGGVAGSVTYLLGRSISEMGYKIALDSFHGGELSKNTEKLKKLIDKSIDESFIKSADTGLVAFKKILKKMGKKGIEK
ncbi:MAG: DUF697 domain-containing protein [Fusobacteriaceae bacterium]